MGVLQILVFITELISCILNDLDTGVIDVDTIWSLLNVLLKSFTELFPLSHELLSFWGLEELLVEFLNGLNLFSLSPVFKSVSDLLNCFGVRDFLGGHFDIIEFRLDGLGTSLADLDLEKVSLVLPVLWDVRDMDLILDGMLELLHLFLEHLSLWRMLECLGFFLDKTSLFVFEGSFPSSLVGLGPLGLEESLISVRDIIDLSREFIHLMIWEMDTLVGFLEVVFEDFADIGPLLDHLLSKWRFHELLVEYLEIVDLLGVCPLLESVLELVHWLGVLNLLEDSLDVLGLRLDSLLTLW
jgi:hypothetical protein